MKTEENEVLQRYDRYKNVFINKTDAQIIESLSFELTDKVETIHSLLKEIEMLKNIVNFSLEDVLGIYVFVQKQRELIINQKDKSDVFTKRLALTFTANVLVDIMNEIHYLVDKREN